MQSVLRNSYAKDLPELSKACLPSGFKKPEIILKNYELGEELGFSKKFLDSDECLNIFSGNANVIFDTLSSSRSLFNV